jgi:hypothetical protein
MSPWVAVGATVIAGLFFFGMRLKCRLLYGISEIIVALGLMYLRYFPHPAQGVLSIGMTGPPPTFLDTLAVEAVPIFVMVYAFVRGCDNLVTGWPWLQDRLGIDRY